MPDSDWFDGYEYPGMPAWGPVTAPSDIVLLPSASRIERGGVTRLTAYSANLAYLGKMARLQVSNPAVANGAWFEAQMQPDAKVGCAAIFEITGVSLGQSVLYVEVV